MKLTPADLNDLRPALLWAGGALLLAVLVSGGAYLYSRWDMRALGELQNQTAQMQQALAEEQERLRIMTTRFPEFEAIRRQGILAAESRLEWQEALDQLQRDRPDLGLSYEIAPQRAIPGLQEGSAQVYASSLALKYSAADERVYSGVNRLLSSLPGKLVARHCRLSREGGGRGIAIDCLYDWLSIATLPGASTPKEGS